MVAASAQPARPNRASPCSTTSGTTDGTPITGSWSNARSRNQLAQNDCASNRVQAVDAKACASPVQPRRSSRCGQSVGTETKLSRCDQNTFEWNRSSAACDDENLLRGARSLEIATAVAATTSAPSTSAYRKPWNVKAGSSTCSPSRPSVYTSVALAERSAFRCRSP